MGLKEDIKITKSSFLSAFILGANSISWAYLTFTIIVSFFNLIDLTIIEKNLVTVTYFFSLSGFNIIGAFISKRFDRLKFLYLWIIFGGAITIVPLFVNISTFESLIIFSLVLGCSVGVGLSSCLAYITKLTVVEERGRLSGIILLVSFIVFPLFTVLVEPLDIYWSVLIFGTWRFCGLFVYFNTKLNKPELKLEKEQQPFILSSFIKYIIPWILFCMVDPVTAQILQSGANAIFPNFALLTIITAGLFCPIGGILIDFVGRKRILSLTLVGLGLGYAMIGLFPDQILTWTLFSVLYGSTWGLLTTVFMLVIWADLAPFKMREKIFAIGILPPFIGNAIAGYLGPLFSPFPITSTFSLVAFFFFLAIIPLLYAPETIPDEILERRKLENYVKDAKKLKKKLS